MSSYKNNPTRRKSGFWIFILTGFTLGGLVFLSCNPTPAITHVPTSIGIMLSATPFPPTVTPTLNTTYNFEVLISELEETMPGANTEGFHIPDKSDKQAFHSMILSIIGNHPAETANLAHLFNYEFLRLFDQADAGAESYVLREQQPINKGWGLYFFRRQTPKNIVIEAPHPVADENTAEVALDLYRALRAKALLIGGTHRDANVDGSADLTRIPDSIFQTVHVALFQPAGIPNYKTIFIQIHGYSAERHPNTPQVVIGYNWKNDPEKDVLLSNIVNALQNNGINVGTCSGKNYRGLCGTSNVQRLATDGGIFIHIELDGSLRKDGRALTTALQQALTP